MLQVEDTHCVVFGEMAIRHKHIRVVADKLVGGTVYRCIGDIQAGHAILEELK